MLTDHWFSRGFQGVRVNNCTLFWANRDRPKWVKNPRFGGCHSTSVLPPKAEVWATNVRSTLDNHRQLRQHHTVILCQQQTSDVVIKNRFGGLKMCALKDLREPDIHGLQLLVDRRIFNRV